jgi:hypothetical protein
MGVSGKSIDGQLVLVTSDMHYYVLCECLNYIVHYSVSGHFGLAISLALNINRLVSGNTDIDLCPRIHMKIYVGLVKKLYSKRILPRV